MERIVLAPVANLAFVLAIIASAPLPAEDVAGRETVPNARASEAQAGSAALPLQDFAGRPIRGSTADGIPEEDARAWHGFHQEPLVIPVPDEALVDRYIAQYSSAEGAKWLAAVMKRGQPWLAFIRQEAAARGIPPELAYLPVVESAFSSSAVSKSGAVGLWQFMKNSVSPFGIRIDDWVDERRDFWKSTDAAFRKLEENHRYFGDWPLALAAYNAGLGAVKRAVDKGGVRDYWILCDKGLLKKETVHYVPKFLAVATVLLRAQRNGIDTGWTEEIRWTRIPVDRTIDLGLLSEESGVPVERLRTANLELQYGVTPPDSGYRLKVRAEDEAAIVATLARKDLQLIRYYFHIVKSGDTLSALSRHYGVSVDLIIRSNPGLQARYLKLGNKIVVPALREVGPYKGEKIIDPSIRFEGGYVVKKGDTLWSIALAFDVDPEALAEANGMDLSSILREGRSIKTPIFKAEGL
ncbi:MAG: hypothetical protein A2Z99_12630 [Treponema sp. GWB1_62_6]|nr:MAG: hypothetical protein A2Y36_09710 [Treponema sp. GWA1_62_8]OHE64356.1 MAG: hypothetical protein A2001_05560 [Treponema sp. GWC1_61_84]OHE70439.1 MAG: hypothetical protein A2Z99_12630 [Treponema sp. GWB1_62_6]HCM27246.1 lytic transglycosylase [Treponema sp.]